MSVGFFRDAQKENKRARVFSKSAKEQVQDFFCTSAAAEVQQQAGLHEPQRKKLRYNEFRPGAQYECVRVGIPLRDNCSPDEVREELTEDHLFHFRYKDKNLGRFSSQIPFYVAALYTKNIYVHPLQGDFKQIYATRTDASLCKTILSDDTPYWTDAYVKQKNKKL